MINFSQIKMKKSLLVGSLSFFALGGGELSFAAEGDTIVNLKAVTPISPGSYISAPIFLFKDFVEEVSEGAVKVNVLGGVEVVPTDNQFEAVQSGAVDVIVGMTSYYTGVVPEAMVLLYTNQSPSQQRESGLFDVLQEAHLNQGDVIYYAHAGGGPQTAFRFYLKNKIEKADFGRDKIRVSGSLRAPAEAVNATPISIPYSDLYLALERGMVDGFGTSYAGIANDKFHEVTSYVLDHPFYSLNDVILINNEAWESIPDNIKRLLLDEAPRFEKMVEEYNVRRMEEEDILLEEAGMEFLKLSSEQEESFYEKVYSSGWESFLDYNPERGSVIKEIAEQ